MKMNIYIVSALLMFAVSFGAVSAYDEDKADYDEIMACFAKCDTGELGPEDTCQVLDLLPTCTTIEQYGFKDYTFDMFVAVKHMKDHYHYN